MDNKVRMFLVWGLGGILFASQAFAAGEQWLRYHYGRDTDQAGTVTRSLEQINTKPAGVEFPEFNDPKPMFWSWKSPMAKGGQVYLALDSDGKPGAYNLLYVDSDCDGSLKDETPIKADKTDQNYTKFGPVKVLLEGPDGPVAYHLNFMYYKYDTAAVRLMVQSACWYEGMITVGGEKKRCVLTDSMANGVFNDISRNYYEADRIVLGDEPKAETAIVGRLLQSGGKLYRLEVARDGAYVKITPADDVAMGKIKAPPEINAISATGENGFFRVPLTDGTGNIPAGEYRIFQWVIEKRDDKNNSWRLAGQGFNESGDFSVKKNETAFLAVGEPIKSKLEVKEKRGKYAFSHSLTGQMGERITLTKNNTQAPAPKLRVVSEDKKFDRSYSFEYG